MDEDDIEILDSNGKKVENARILPTAESVSETDSEQLPYKFKLDELRNKVANMKRRRASCEKESKVEENAIKKTKNSKTQASSSDTADVLSETKTKTLLPSFQSLSAVPFESVIKQQPEMKIKDLEDTKVQNSLLNGTSTAEKAQLNNDQIMIGPEEAPIRNSTKVHMPSFTESSQCEVVSELTLEQNSKQEKEGHKPILKVLFRDHEIARLFRKSVCDALTKVFACTDLEQDDSSQDASLELKIWESDISEPSEIIVDDNGLFQVDTNPTKIPQRSHLPKYQQLVTNALSGKCNEEESAKDLGAGSVISSACFNCNGSHLISECTKPVDESTVNRNRQKYMQNKKSQAKSSRYHIDEEQRFAHIAPGKISDALRCALGLKKNQLPRYIYRMRMFGYPPGWLEEIKITHSGIALINESHDVQETTNLETDAKDTYDVSKLIDYPGFNVQSNDTIDESRRHGCPAMQWKNSKERMISTIGNNASKAYSKKRKNKNNNSKNDIEDKQENEDSHSGVMMDIVEIDDVEMIVLDSTADTDVLEVSSQQSNCEDVSQPESGACSQDSSRAVSPDIVILEAQKQRLLIELEENESSSLSSTACIPSSSSTAKTICTTPDNRLNRTKSLDMGTPDNALGRTKTLDMGTPIIKSASPFASLPTAEKFSKGISDHLNFENLPDATGKYFKMKAIIDKVRSSVRKDDNDVDDECS